VEKGTKLREIRGTYVFKKIEMGLLRLFLKEMGFIVDTHPVIL